MWQQNYTEERKRKLCMNKKRIVLTMLLVVVIGRFCFEVNAAYMGCTGVVKSEIGLKAVMKVKTLSLSESNAEKAASCSDAEWKASAGNAEKKGQSGDSGETDFIR